MKHAGAIYRMTGWFFEPVLAPILKEQWIIRSLTVLAALQLGLTVAGMQGWRCPINSVLGVPCPGCGLSTAMALLIQGNWQTALQVHAFAPFFVILVIFFAAAGLMPRDRRDRLACRIAAIERRTGVAVLMIGGMVTYWALRLFNAL